jgi:anaerobic magnesium-protoporphyrin IX monomethyl ester cyclase
LPTISSAFASIGCAISRRCSRLAERRTVLIQLRAVGEPGHSGRARDARCREVWLGAEAAAKNSRRDAQGTRVAEIEQARRALGAEGIRVGFFLMLGYVGEELDDILATRELVERTRPDDIGVSVAYPLPGTKFFDLVKRELGAKRNWEESNDLDMMFFGTYRSEFYRSVRNLLHDQVAEGHRRPCAAAGTSSCAAKRSFARAAAATRGRARAP